MDVRRVVVPAECRGKRLDRALTELLPEFSRARLQRLIAEGHVTASGVPLKPSLRLKGGEEIVVTVPAIRRAEDGPQPEALDVAILYQDAALVVVNKPPGMAVHPAPGTPSGTLVNALLYSCPDLTGIGGVERPGIVHRLDKDTSGVMVVAKTEGALRRLQAEFKARRVEKHYRALVHGVPPARGTIRRPLARHPKDRKRYTSRWAKGRPDAREAVTHFEVVERFDGAAELVVSLETGRTHQIRVHFTDEGHPLLGDPVYGSARRDRATENIRRAVLALRRQALHAWRLAFAHPVSGRRMAFEAPVGRQWEAARALLRGEARPRDA